jgi:hypothetical protein
VLSNIDWSVKVRKIKLEGVSLRVTEYDLCFFFDKSTFPHAGQREKKSFFHAAITFFHTGITFFHAGITFLHARITFFYAGYTFLVLQKTFEIPRILICCTLI